MYKLLKKRVSWPAIAASVAFLMVQVICDMNLPSITSDMINNGVAKGDIDYIWSVGFKMLVVAAIGMIGAIGNVYIAAKVAQKAGSSLRGDVFKRVLGFGNQEIDGFSTSSLITRTTNDVLQIQNVVLMFLRMMLMSPLMIIGASIMAYQNEKRLTMVFLVSVPLLAIVIGIIMRFSVPLFKSLQGKIDRINLTFREGLTGVRVIRAFRQDKFEQDRFKEANKDYTETGIKVFSIVSLMFPIMNLILNGTNMTIVWFGAKLIGDKTMEVGNLVSFMTYANMILFSFMMLSMVFVFIPRAQAAAERLNEVLDTKYTITDPDDPERFTADAPSELEFDNVDFYYEGAEKPALAKTDFKAVAGQTVAIIGGTGCGKSTLINMIPRLYDATDGTVKVNGKDVKKVAQKDLHDKISFVQQKAVLFKGTIRSNMLFGKTFGTHWKLLSQKTSFQNLKTGWTPSSNKAAATSPVVKDNVWRLRAR